MISTKDAWEIGRLQPWVRRAWLLILAPAALCAWSRRELTLSYRMNEGLVFGFILSIWRALRHAHTCEQLGALKINPRLFDRFDRVEKPYLVKKVSDRIGGTR